MEYKTVDVFTTKPLKGNPVAVVLDGSKLSSSQMQDVARWTNLSETTFVIPATNASADYQVRIFTPNDELPFAGHPSLGTAHALLEAGILKRKDRLVQQCKRGLISLNVTDSMIEFGLEISEYVPFTSVDIEGISKALSGLELSTEKPPMIVNAGPRWIVAQAVGTEVDLLKYEPNFSAIDAFSKQINADGICVFAVRSDGSNSIELRTFAPTVGVSEDPVCGSGQAAVAFFRALDTAYIAKQGSAIRRDGEARLRYGDGKIWVSGACVTVASGHLHLE